VDKQEVNMVGFEIVAYSGDARAQLLQLLKEMRGGNFDNVDSILAEVDENLNQAHNAQTKIMSDEAGGKDIPMGIIFAHGQDHLMTTILLRDIITDFIDLYKTKAGK